MVSPVGEPREVLQRKLQADARLASTSSSHRHNGPSIVPFVATHSRSGATSTRHPLASTSTSSNASTTDRTALKENIGPVSSVASSREKARKTLVSESSIASVPENKVSISKSVSNSLDPVSSELPPFSRILSFS